MKRGAVYWINLEDTSPPEFGKVRPGLIFSNSEQNTELPTVVVLPISSQPPEIWPLRIALEPPMKKLSFIVIPGIRQVSKTRIEELIGYVDEEALTKITDAVFTYLTD